MSLHIEEYNFFIQQLENKNGIYTNENAKNQDFLHCYGSEKFYRYPLNPNYIYTDGILEMAESLGLFWLVGEILLQSRNEDFLSWNFVKNLNGKNYIFCDDGNYNLLYSKEIPFTDFEGNWLRWYLVDNVLLLPSEY